MFIRLNNLRRHRWLASLLVVVLALRALIPVGFMPTGDGKLALQICPEGFPAALLHGPGHHHEHHHSAETPGHDHKSWMQGHCPFGAAAGAPAAGSSLVVTVDLKSAPPLPDTAIVAAVLDFRFLVAQPRAPPTRLV
jgi:Protein of unknown function (DUF2946)